MGPRGLQIGRTFLGVILGRSKVAYGHLNLVFVNIIFSTGYDYVIYCK